MRLLTIALAVLGLAACSKPEQQPAANESVASPEETEGKGVDRSHRGDPAPAAVFTDAGGKSVTLADFKGKPVLVNLWATWCAPCVKELPTLDQVARSSGLKVLAVSQDSGPHASVVAFLKSHQIEALEPYQDDKMALSGALGPDTVLPTSILFDATGKEVWRFVGDLDWISPEAAKLLSEASAGARGDQRQPR